MAWLFVKYLAIYSKENLLDITNLPQTTLKKSSKKFKDNQSGKISPNLDTPSQLICQIDQSVSSTMDPLPNLYNWAGIFKNFCTASLDCCQLFDKFKFHVNLCPREKYFKLFCGYRLRHLLVESKPDKQVTGWCRFKPCLRPVSNLIKPLCSSFTTLESYLTGKYPILRP